MAYKDPAKQKAYNAKRQAAHRAAQKAKANPSSISGDASESGEPMESPDGLEIEVIAEEQPEAPKLSLLERTMAKLGMSADAQPARRSTRRGKKSSENLLVTALPVVLASLVVTYCTNMLPDEYKACAPTQEEVTGIISPLMEIIGRRVEIVGKVNQDATDILSSLVCAFMMGARMYVTYADIRNEGNPHEKAKPTREESYRRSLEREADIYTDDSELGGDHGVTLAGGMRSHQAARQGIASNGAGNNGGAILAHVSENDAERNGADVVDNPGTPGDSEAAKVANLFRRDITGRQQLGLLPVRV